jgi:hypothetical protein
MAQSATLSTETRFKQICFIRFASEVDIVVSCIAIVSGVILYNTVPCE